LRHQPFGVDCHHNSETCAVSHSPDLQEAARLYKLHKE
jgi:hypothetical protein